MTTTAPQLSRRRQFALTGGLAAAGVLVDAPLALAAPPLANRGQGVRAAQAFLTQMANAYPQVSQSFIVSYYFGC